MKTKKNIKYQVPVSKRKHVRIIYLLSLVLVPLVLYFRVVNFGLTELDDDTIIAGINNTEGSKLNLKEAFTHDAMMSNRGDSFYRPLQIISLMTDAEIGGNEPWIYHLSNLILHILTVVTLFFFLKRTGIKEEISFLLSMLFSVSPVFTNAVAWIPARGDLLLCLFSLLLFISIIEYFQNGKRVYLIIHGIFFAAAIFSKETAVLLPLLILSYLYFVQRKKLLLKEIAPFLFIWIITLTLFFVLRQSVLKINHTANEFGIIPFIKNLPAIPITLGKFFIPYGLSTLPAFNNTALIIGIILMIILALLIIKLMRGDKRIIVWGILWFLVFTIPPMLFRSIDLNLGIEKYDYLDFREYLPIAGLLVIIGFILNDNSAIMSLKKMLIFFLPVLIIYAVMAFHYSDAFADPVSFYTSAINANPKNIINLVVRGTIYYGQGNIQKSMSDYDDAIRIDPTYSLPYYNRGLVFETLNDHDQAEKSFSLALNYDTLYKDNNFLRESSYLNLSSEKIILKKYDEAISILRKAISKYPDDSNLHFNLGVVYNYSAKYDSALTEYNKVADTGKNSPEYFNNRGIIKLKLNDFEGAVNDLTKAINLNQDYGDAWYYRGLAYLKLNKPAEAESDWDQARKLGFKDPVNK